MYITDHYRFDKNISNDIKSIPERERIVYGSVKYLWHKKKTKSQVLSSKVDISVKYIVQQIRSPLLENFRHEFNSLFVVIANTYHVI
jgi:DNA-directed RNA polymerase specialized sigma subunit